MRTSLRLVPNIRRVIAMPFIPGEEMPGGASRASSIIDRILAMDDGEVGSVLAATRRRFDGRHRHLEATWSDHFRLASTSAGHGTDADDDRALLIGAYFTRECALETAALFNPSIVAHPDQGSVPHGHTRVVMSLRAVGEGHISAIEFRTGVVDGEGGLRLDAPGAFPTPGRTSPGPFRRSLFAAQLAARGCDGADAATFLDNVAPSFDASDLERALAAMERGRPETPTAAHSRGCIRWVASNNYSVAFPAETTIADRVLWPSAPAESHGMEDARFVRFVGDDGTVTYLATYTGFDRRAIASRRVSTTDFRTFAVSQMSGPYAENKGMALFPRTIAGRHVALSRWNRERSAVAVSDDGIEWAEATTLAPRLEPWELIQVGNCGSPLETADGWLVLTHGVGPMREYVIAAMLLDLDDPGRVIGVLSEPLLRASDDERDGYVPNVVYSCGALIAGETLVLPYSYSDTAIGVAAIDLPALLDRLTGPRP
jgi:predicted GH43/DUF377 family glycosyl hydrolase